jgi:hypothetical protein
MIFNVFLNCVIIFITCFVNSTLGFIYTHLFHGKLFSKNYFFKFFCVSLLLKKLVNEKYFPVKEKFSLVFKKVFFFLRKTLSKSYKKFRHVMLFADYIKFDPQTFDCYIFYFEFFFFNLRIWFNLIFISTLILIFMIVIYFFLITFLIKIFYLSDLILILLIVICFIWNNFVK